MYHYSLIIIKMPNFQSDEIINTFENSPLIKILTISMNLLSRTHFNLKIILRRYKKGNEVNLLNKER